MTAQVVIHPTYVSRLGAYRVVQDLYDKGLTVTAPKGSKYFAAQVAKPATSNTFSGEQK
jgi:hypothetical protein